MWSFLTDKEKLILLSGIFEGEGTFGNHKGGKLRSGKTRYQIWSYLIPFFYNLFCDIIQN